tara:strand:- start:144 stop:539 length:396 start_codon:yes stop_codon:yes gene_type:complete
MRIASVLVAVGCAGLVAACAEPEPRPAHDGYTVSSVEAVDRLLETSGVRRLVLVPVPTTTPGPDDDPWFPFGVRCRERLADSTIRIEVRGPDVDQRDVAVIYAKFRAHNQRTLAASRRLQATCVLLENPSD